MSLGYQHVYHSGLLTAAATSGPIDIALSPVVVEVVVIRPSFFPPINIALSPVVVEVAIPQIDVAVPRNIDLTPVVVEVVTNTPTVQVPSAVAAGMSIAIFENAALASIAQVVAVSWETRRYLNRVGTFVVEIPASVVVDNDILARSIQRGWRVSLIQEDTRPLDRADLEFLMYRGIVEDKTYRVDESGTAVCRLEGSFRGLELAARSTPTNAEYSGTMAAAATDIVGGLAGGISSPANGSREITLSFNVDGDGQQITGRYSRLLRLGEYARWALRETWELDALEFVSIDGPPDSGYILTSMEAAASGRSPGVALIGATPEVRREGRGIVNRVIPFGSDVELQIDVQSETTLELLEDRSGTAPTDPPVLTIAVQPTAGKTMIIAGRLWEFTNTDPPIAGFIYRGANVAAARTNIVAAVNGTDGINQAHPYISLGAFGGNGLAADEARIFIDDPEGLGSTTVTFGGTFTDDVGNAGAAGDLGQAQAEVQVPLTLEHATRRFPFEVRSGVNGDGSTYWYVQDTESINRFGLVEIPMHRTDVKNPNASNNATRIAAANVLHQIASLEIQRHRAPKLFFSCPLANGPDVWALPGDRIRVQYTGNVLYDGEVLMWEDIDFWFLVVERGDRVGEDGAREVTLTLATSDLPDVTVPEFPKDSVFPVAQDNALPQVLSSLGFNGGDSLPGFGGSLLPSCCDDPSATVTETEEDEAPCYLNPGFETDTAEWFTDDDDAPGGIIFWGNGDAGLSLTRHTGDAHSGDACGRLQQVGTVGFSTGCGQNVGCADLVPGRTYEVSIWYKGDASDLFLYVGEPGTNGTPASEYFIELENAADWTEATGRFTVGPEFNATSQGQVAIASGVLGGVEFDILIDDATIVAVESEEE